MWKFGFRLCAVARRVWQLAALAVWQIAGGEGLGRSLQGGAPKWPPHNGGRVHSRAARLFTVERRIDMAPAWRFARGKAAGKSRRGKFSGGISVCGLNDRKSRTFVPVFAAVMSTCGPVFLNVALWIFRGVFSGVGGWLYGVIVLCVLRDVF